MDEDPRGYRELLAAHDEALAEKNLEIWIGAEPTFTLPGSVSPEWLGEALGDEKREFGLRLVPLLARPGDAILRSVGRQYPEEDLPRWNIGLFGRRDDTPLWSGPPDPALLSGPRAAPTDESARRLRDRFAQVLRDKPLPGLREGVTSTFEAATSLPFRIVAGIEQTDEEAFSRPPVDSVPTPPSGLEDPIESEGGFLACFGVDGSAGAICAQLGRCGDVERFLAVLERLGDAARDSGLRALTITGFPPPTSAEFRHLTITPDPGVIELNMAPHPNVVGFLEDTRRIHDAAASLGLLPLRRHFNGEVTDTGGGGHLTFGASSPAASPFFRHPLLLPRMVAYFNHHPALSYAFAAVGVAGGSGQAPRPDEGARESFEELGVAIDRLGRELSEPAPAVETTEADEVFRDPTIKRCAELLWGTLAPLLTDRFGNTHRAELNVEKLCNPWLPDRGKLGLVELRAFRQAPTPEHDAARATLIRSILGRLAAEPFPLVLKDWGSELHDRFALPFFLEQDLREVLGDLDRAGFGLPQELVDELLDDGYRRIAEVRLGDELVLTMRQAVEFWPLVGDLSRQGETTRLVDASTRRVELRLEGSPRLIGGAHLGLRVGKSCYRVPVVRVDAGTRRAPAAVGSVRYRAFVPNPGLHPSIPALDPLILEVTLDNRTQQISYYGWKPGGGVYEGLPQDDVEADERRGERIVVEEVTGQVLANPPRGAASRHCLDSRRL